MATSTDGIFRFCTYFVSTRNVLSHPPPYHTLQVGSGPRSSALVGGFTLLHRQLEVALARLKGTEDALLFPTGYAANTAVVSVLAAGAAVGPAAAASPQHPTHPQQQQPMQQRVLLQPQHLQQQQEEPEVVIFSDELNHASIIDGARLASRGPGVTLQVYRHNDMSHLEQLLAAAPERARKLVATDSLFSMDGDYADLQVCFFAGRVRALCR